MFHGYGEVMDTRKVLIAEDDPAVRKAVQRVLELENYEVTAVNDGQAAVRGGDRGDLHELGAQRGGAVSGIGGHNAAMALLELDS